MSTCKINNQIRRLRFENGEMTQQALATEVGVTRQTILAIEAGRYSPSLEVAFKIARTFNEPLEAVFQYEPEPA
ncbi:helix-turn-helix transcriptional regulator [Pseudoteredinibacter isoporae]|uniref:Putative transcriptional regulator n=1 Tax=Pseudoteredinibacter isoporae TaxID=570281 RepID=A0A7X0MTV0_9GAMM|nr:helix-turn-helix transcriptional regulator [Pseudoteredinibacter isoporae]MBB6519931.1 putative transcriptional regulator [Pseudoteredinibacter isoporae]NHO85507.1 helix-turn-helix transcriptional regulator [Pseudoteredinibacter isoporae]NIB26041.1 helix-turn-helix transcriptional regulator [Pseudoteredinibacter isoporae]